jgi:hypothetical protein
MSDTFGVDFEWKSHPYGVCIRSKDVGGCWLFYASLAFAAADMDRIGTDAAARLYAITGKIPRDNP